MVTVKTLEELEEALKTKQVIVLDLPLPSPDGCRALAEKLYDILKDHDVTVAQAPAPDMPLLSAADFLQDIKLPEKLEMSGNGARGHLKKAFPRDLPPNIASRIKKLGNFTPPGKPRRHR